MIYRHDTGSWTRLDEVPGKRDELVIIHADGGMERSERCATCGGSGRVSVGDGGRYSMQVDPPGTHGQIARCAACDGSGRTWRELDDGEADEIREALA